MKWCFSNIPFRFSQCLLILGLYFQSTIELRYKWLAFVKWWYKTNFSFCFIYIFIIYFKYIIIHKEFPSLWTRWMCLWKSSEKEKGKRERKRVQVQKYKIFYKINERDKNNPLGWSNINEGKAFHSFKVLVKTGVALITVLLLLQIRWKERVTRHPRRPRGSWSGRDEVNRAKIGGATKFSRAGRPRGSLSRRQVLPDLLRPVPTYCGSPRMVTRVGPTMYSYSATKGKSPGNEVVYSTQARSKRRSIHAPNLTNELSTAVERRLNQFGSAV